MKRSIEKRGVTIFGLLPVFVVPAVIVYLSATILNDPLNEQMTITFIFVGRCRAHGDGPRLRYRPLHESRDSRPWRPARGDDAAYLRYPDRAGISRPRHLL